MATKDIRHRVVYDDVSEDFELTLPEHLPGFAVPVPKSFFLEIFIKKQRQEGLGKQRSITYFIDTAYALSSGGVFYTDPDVRSIIWGKALQKDFHLYQIIEATVPNLVTERKPGNTMLLEVWESNPDREKLNRLGRIQTTQDDFLWFLKTGDRAILE